MLGYRAKYRSKASQGLGRFVWERSISWVLEELPGIVKSLGKHSFVFDGTASEDQLARKSHLFAGLEGRQGCLAENYQGSLLSHFSCAYSGAPA